MIWKQIKGFEGLYEVSDEGLVKKLACAAPSKNGGFRNYNEKILKPSKANNSLIVRLVKNGKSSVKCVHRLVAETFIDNPDDLRIVGHKDGDIYNNRADNLVWEYSVKKALKDDGLIYRNMNVKNPTIIQFDLEGNKVRSWESQKDITEQLGISYSVINRCLNGYCKTTYGFKWAYIWNTSEKKKSQM